MLKYIQHSGDVKIIHDHDDVNKAELKTNKQKISNQLTHLKNFIFGQSNNLFFFFFFLPSKVTKSKSQLTGQQRILLN